MTDDLQELAAEVGDIGAEDEMVNDADDDVLLTYMANRDDMTTVGIRELATEMLRELKEREDDE